MRTKSNLALKDFSAQRQAFEAGRLGGKHENHVLIRSGMSVRFDLDSVGMQRWARRGSVLQPSENAWFRFLPKQSTRRFVTGVRAKTRRSQQSSSYREQYVQRLTGTDSRPEKRESFEA